MIEFAPMLVPFFVITGGLVLIGLSQTHASVHGGSGVKGWLSWVLHGGPVAALLNVASQALRAITSRFAAAQLAALAAFFAAFAVFWRKLFQTHGDFAAATIAAIEALDHAIPGEARKAAAPAARQAKVAHKIANHANAKAASEAHALARFKAHANPRIAHATHAVDVTLPHDIAGLRARNKALERQQTKDAGAIRDLEDGAIRTWEWIRSHPLSGITGAFAGAVAIALARLGWGFLRCRNWQRVARRITCGMGGTLANLLDDGLLSLLGMFFAAEAVVNYRTLVQIGQGVEREVAEGIHELLSLGE